MNQYQITAESVAQFSEQYKEPAIKELRDQLAAEFLGRIHREDFEDKKELEALKIDEKAIEYASVVVDKLINKMKGY